MRLDVVGSDKPFNLQLPRLPAWPASVTIYAVNLETMMKTMLKLSSLVLAATALSACSTLHHLDSPSTPYQQCNGLKQKIMFVGTNMNGNGYSDFQVQQQKQQLQQQFNNLNCQIVLQNKAKYNQLPPATTASSAAPSTQK